VWAGVDNAWEQEKLEARKLLENGARAKRSPTRHVHIIPTPHLRWVQVCSYGVNALLARSLF
jgi:hypothetical protein